jgi:hypothetical protein
MMQKSDTLPKRVVRFQSKFKCVGRSAAHGTRQCTITETIEIDEPGTSLIAPTRLVTSHVRNMDSRLCAGEIAQNRSHGRTHLSARGELHNARNAHVRLRLAARTGLFQSSTTPTLPGLGEQSGGPSRTGWTLVRSAGPLLWCQRAVLRRSSSQLRRRRPHVWNARTAARDARTLMRRRQPVVRHARAAARDARTAS